MEGINIQCNHGEYEIIMPSGAKIKIKEDGCEIIAASGGERASFDADGKSISNIYNDFGCLKYFKKMGKKQRKAVKHWLKSQNPKNPKEVKFLELVSEATIEVQYGYHIATVEALFDRKKIYFKENSESCIELSGEEWNKKAEEFAPQYKSKAATLYELYYWYAYNVAIGEWTFEDVENASRKNIIVLRGI